MTFHYVTKAIANIHLCAKKAKLGGPKTNYVSSLNTNSDMKSIHKIMKNDDSIKIICD